MRIETLDQLLEGITPELLVELKVNPKAAGMSTFIKMLEVNLELKTRLAKVRDAVEACNKHEIGYRECYQQVHKLVA